MDELGWIIEETMNYFYFYETQRRLISSLTPGDGIPRKSGLHAASASMIFEKNGVLGDSTCDEF